MPEPDPATWSTCATCGDALPPGARACPTCGKETSGQATAEGLTPKTRRRLKIHRGLRIFLVVGVAVALIGVMALAVYQGPPVAADPLTNTWVYNITAGNYSVFSGSVTGGDYIAGNFTVVTPPGANVLFEVFNNSSYRQFAAGLPAVPQAPSSNATEGVIDFAAVVTDTYYFVWVDAYAAPSHIDITVYASTEYMSNVLVQ
jgi:hypothetical protein